jgi:Transglycosylase
VISRRLQIAIVAGGIAGVSVCAAFAPLVRYEVSRAAERYGGAVTVQSVIPTLHGLRLRGVDITLSEVPSAAIRLDQIDVTLFPGARTFALHGGLISLVGSRFAVLRQVDAFRARLAPTEARPTSSADTKGTALSIDGLNLAWKNDLTSPTETVTASAIRIDRGSDHLRLAADAASIRVGRADLEVKGGRIQIRHVPGGAYRIEVLATDALEAELVAPEGRGHPDRPPAPEPSPETNSPREALIETARALDLLLEPNAKVQLAGVHARVRHGDDTINFGPGRLDVTRFEGRMVIALAPELPSSPPNALAPSASSPAPSLAPLPTPTRAEHDESLTFRLSVPVSSAPETPQDILADIQGGPIGLAALGVKEGDFGLFNVASTAIVTRSHIILAPDGETLSVEGEGKIHGLSLRSAALSDEPVAGLELAFRINARGHLDASQARVEASEVDLGSIRVLVQGDYERTATSLRVHGAVELPLTACQAMLDSVPRGLVSKLHGIRMAGSFGLKGKVAFDTAHLDRGFSAGWDLANTCRVVEAPIEIDVGRFQKPFRHTAYDPEGHPVEIEAGPGTPSYTELRGISKFMEVAVITTEDGGFHRHHGFDQEAIKNSIRENLRRRKFVRGASTISMQLAKNLYLDRTKNLARKLQEAILTMYLEQELTKEQILELYLNVIEFGPMIYGISPAARHYFNATAADLSLSQALYIASIMPNPKVQHFGPDGALTPAWTSYLRKLMKIAHDRHNITDDELDEGLREAIVRGSASPGHDLHPPSPSPGGGDDAPDAPESPGGWLSP